MPRRRRPSGVPRCDTGMGSGVGRSAILYLFRVAIHDSSLVTVCGKPLAPKAPPTATKTATMTETTMTMETKAMAAAEARRQHGGSYQLGGSGRSLVRARCWRRWQRGNGSTAVATWQRGRPAWWLRRQLGGSVTLVAVAALIFCVNTVRRRAKLGKNLFPMKMEGVYGRSPTVCTAFNIGS